MSGFWGEVFLFGNFGLSACFSNFLLSIILHNLPQLVVVTLNTNLQNSSRVFSADASGNPSTQGLLAFQPHETSQCSGLDILCICFFQFLKMLYDSSRSQFHILCRRAWLYIYVFMKNIYIYLCTYEQLCNKKCPQTSTKKPPKESPNNPTSRSGFSNSLGFCIHLSRLPGSMSPRPGKTSYFRRVVN